HRIDEDSCQGVGPLQRDRECCGIRADRHPPDPADGQSGNRDNYRTPACARRNAGGHARSGPVTHPFGPARHATRCRERRIFLLLSVVGLHHRGGSNLWRWRSLLKPAVALPIGAGETPKSPRSVSKRSLRAEFAIETVKSVGRTECIDRAEGASRELAPWHSGPL